MRKYGMKNTNLYLPGFHLATLRRTPRSASQKLADELARIRHHTINQLGESFTGFIPKRFLQPEKSGKLSRRRLFSKENIFWGFFSQILDAESGCAEVVRKFHAFAALRSLPMPSTSSSAYCQARQKLEQGELESILIHTAGQLTQQRSVKSDLDSRRVIVVDGTGVSMPDTQSNQEQWPQQKQQKPGCGFPQARICACFDLRSGGVLSYQIGNRKQQELPLLRQQWDTFKSGDIFLGDKGFCSFYDVSKFSDRNVDSVLTLARRKPVTATNADKILGEDDLLIHWPKPKWSKNLSYSKEEWLALPEKLPLRQIKVNVNEPGFRIRTLYIITTLLDSRNYSAKQLSELYYQRWDVELFFRDIKTTIGMDILRCKSPNMIQKEVLMHFIVYNCIRLLILKAAKQKGVSPRNISFKASIQALRQWEPLLKSDMKSSERNRLIDLLYNCISASEIHQRPGRREPRCIKRRPKNFQLLNKPRHEMIEISHRSRYSAKQA